MLNAQEYARIEGGTDDFLTRLAVTDPLVQWVSVRFITHGTA